MNPELKTMIFTEVAFVACTVTLGAMSVWNIFAVTATLSLLFPLWLIVAALWIPLLGEDE